MKPNPYNKGFSFIELVITVAILGVLASAAFPMAKLASQRTKEQELKQSLRQIRTAIDAYKQASDEGRISRSITLTGYPPTLATLVNGVDDEKDPDHKKIYFLRKLPKDPLAENEANPEESWGKRSYASSSENPQEGTDVFDVYSKATGVGLNGIPYQEW